MSFENGAANPSRIVVARAAPAATALGPTVGLTTRTSATSTQDKPMMTIDNSPSSPTYGRLYVVWDEPDVNIVISQCDTRPGGVLNAANCDNADNWTVPVSVTPFSGSYIYPDVAVGPGGKVYVVWWDYSSTNAIRGATCAGATGCSTAAAWSAPATIATLDATNGLPIPFACPIMAQPGGRVAPATQVDVDRSGGPNNGRVYVTWSDLRAGSGTTRCATNASFPKGSPQAPTHLTWDSFVASAVGTLPGSANPSATVGTRLLTDGEDGGQANSDDWFPWLVVDQTNGKVWADFYSTRDDATRKTTKFYLRSVLPRAGDSHQMGGLLVVSSATSDYSGNTCCNFGNDYGDYTGLDATGNVALPVWSNKQSANPPGPDGEAFAFVTTADATSPDTAIASGPADGGLTDATPDFGFTATEPGSVFECDVDGGGFSACTNPMTTSPLGDGSHTLQVRATDPAANTDASPASRTFTSDGTPPDTGITSGPADGATTSSATAAFGLTSPEASATFECQVDGAAFAACTSPLTTPALSDGSHTFQARAVDTVGNPDASPATRTFTVDTTPPDTSITSGPAEGAVTRTTTPAFGFSSSEAGSTFECQVDSDGFAACASPLTTPVLADGAHTFQVRATDAVGNLDASPAARTFTVDTTPPETSITSGPADGAVTRSTRPAFGFASSEAFSTFECQIDGAAFAACVSPLTTPPLLDGPHSFAARATDGAGNVDATPVARGFTVLRPVVFSSKRLRKVRVTRKRVVVLSQPRGTCPAGTPACTLRATASALLGGKRAGIGFSRRTVAPGRAAGVRFTLSKKAFRALKRRKRLRARVVIVGTHGTLRATVKPSVVLLPPR